MTAVITTSRWNAIDPNYKAGSPTEGTAGILRLTTDKGTVLVPAEIVDRRRLFAFGPLVATPGALRALVAEGADPARLLSRHGQGDWGALSADDHDANDQAVPAGSAYSAPTTSEPLACGSSPTPRSTARQAARECAPATPPPSCCLRSTDRCRPSPTGSRHRSPLRRPSDRVRDGPATPTDRRQPVTDKKENQQ